MRILVAILSLAVLLSTFAFAGVSAQEDATPTASPSNAVRERVREKIEELVKRPRALVGTLDQITDSTLRIKTRSGEAKLASTSEETLFFRVAAGTRSQIKFADLVLGDFIISMGFRNGSDVLEATRIITVDANPIPVRRAVYGIVEEGEKGILTIRHPQTDDAWTVNTTSKTVVTKKTEGKVEEVKVSDIAVGDRIVAAGTPVAGKENTLTAGRIHVIPGKAEGL